MTNYLYKKYDTQKLISMAQNNDVKALETLIRNEQKNIYAMFSHLTDKKEDISDLTQEVLLKMAKNISQLKEAKYFKSWLNRIITNTYYDYVKKFSNKHIEYNEKKISEIKDKIGCEPGEKCFFAEAEKLIRAAMLTLPQALRLALILREYEGLSYEDISKIMNTTLGTVKSRISRARLKLQEELKEFI